MGTIELPAEPYEVSRGEILDHLFDEIPGFSDEVSKRKSRKVLIYYSKDRTVRCGEEVSRVTVTIMVPKEPVLDQFGGKHLYPHGRFTITFEDQPPSGWFHSWFCRFCL